MDRRRRELRNTHTHVTYILQELVEDTVDSPDRFFLFLGELDFVPVDWRRVGHAQMGRGQAEEMKENDTAID